MKKNLRQLMVLMGLAVFSVSLAQGQEAAPAPRGWNLKDWDLIPIQSAGRVKPMGAFAGEIVLHVTSRREFEGWRPSEMLLSIVTQPKMWREKLLIKIDRKDVKRQLLLDESRQRFSVSELFNNPTLLQYAQTMGSGESTLAKPPNPNADPREEELKRVFDRLMVFHRIVMGDDLKIIPSDAGVAWEALNPGGESKSESMQQIFSDQTSAGKIRSAFVEVMGAYLNGNEKAFVAGTSNLKNLVEDEATKKEPAFAKTVISRLKAEKVYHDLRPFHWAWMLYAIAALFFGIAKWLEADGVLSGKSFFAHRAGLGTMFLALGLHVTGFGLRSFVAGRPPVSNMYESIVWVSFGAVVFALVIYFF
ncbi:MAG: hypothetical protein KGQ59_11190, partial [Bdellovibrionales bacterium]|nr:hypothetical protein [Bdellovibrionales bacterium]